jgi:hypothetical protein
MESFIRMFAAAMLSAVVSASNVIPGTFALAGAQAGVQATLTIQSRGPSATVISIRETANAKPVTDFEIEMLYRLHLIVVRSDFQQFFHIHPKFNENDGSFTTTLPIDAAHTYYAYADTYPMTMTQQVFRFTIPPTGAAATPVPITTAPSGVNQPAGPYTIHLEKTTFRAGDDMQTLNIDILRNGKPATDLHPYLGRAGHVVLINEKTLAYTHVHPVMNGADAVSVGFAGPHLVLELPPTEAGTYKLWFQFRGGKKLYVGAYTIAVR